MYDSRRMIEMLKTGVGMPAYIEALTLIYKQYKNTYTQRLKNSKHQLPPEAVQDIYHQSIVILVQKIQQDKLKNLNIASYLWGICQKLSLQYRDQQIRLKSNQEKYGKNIPDTPTHNAAEDQLMSEAYRNLIDQIFRNIGEKCKKILLWRQMNFSYREIASKLNPETPSSEDSIRVIAGRCNKNLIRLIKKKPELKKQIDELLK